MTEKEELLELINQKDREIKTLTNHKKDLEKEYCKKYSPFQLGDFAELYWTDGKFAHYVKVEDVKKSGEGFVYMVQPMKKDLSKQKRNCSIIKAGSPKSTDITVYKLAPLQNKNGQQ